MERENVLRWFQDTAERMNQEPCLQFKQDRRWRTLDWDQTLKKVQVLSEALKKLGMGRMDRIAVLSNTRVEWTLYDLAILSLGAVTVPIYQSNTAEECEHILGDSESRIVIVENSTQLEKILKIRGQLPKLEKVILIEGTVMGDGVLTQEEVEKMGAEGESDFGSRIRTLNKDDLATLVYTSGTTGKPKGVMLTHGNLLAEVEGLIDRMAIDHNWSGLFFLPLAHILARVVQFYQLCHGFTHAYAESIEKLTDNLAEIRPHFIVCVPRIFEKIFSGMLSQVESSSSAKKAIFYWAKDVGKAYSDLQQARKPIPMGLKWKLKIATALVYSKLHKKLGGRMQFFFSGGAPLSPEIAGFFNGAGLTILEGYGLTETTAGINANGEEDYRFGTVGRPLLGMEEKIASDGEILARGPMIAKGYWKRPEETKEVFEEDGWFHTGDIGEFTEDGMLKITDRKKDIIVTAGGKNIAPQNIENMIKTDPLISQVVVHGDKRKFLSALVTLNPEKIHELAEQFGIEKDPAAVAQDPKVKEHVKKIIDSFNSKLASYETIKKFAIVEKDFSIEGGELTPTLKVKRKVINQRFKDIFDGFYND